MATQKQKILREIERNPGQTDDEIAEKLGIPRQNVQTLCVQLAELRDIKRFSSSQHGDRRKIRNYPTRTESELLDITIVISQVEKADNGTPYAASVKYALDVEGPIDRFMTYVRMYDRTVEIAQLRA